MFDKLVESTNVKPQGRSKFYLAITAIYGVSLTVLGVLTIMWFNPMPAEAYERIGMLAPPPPTAPAPVTRIIQRAEVAPRNFAPTIIPKEFVNPHLVKPAPPATKNIQTVAGGINTGVRSVDGPPSFNNNSTVEDAPAPLPVPKSSPSPTPKVEPIPTPAPKNNKPLVSK